MPGPAAGDLDQGQNARPGPDDIMKAIAQEPEPASGFHALAAVEGPSFITE